MMKANGMNFFLIVYPFYHPEITFNQTVNLQAIVVAKRGGYIVVRVLIRTQKSLL